MANDSSSTSLKWFIEVEGKKTGPYTAEQIQGLLRDGEVRPDTRVTTEILGDQWIPVDRMIQTYCNAEMTGFFQPPPRPAEPSEDATQQIKAENTGDDPARSLFEVLQAARERKQAQKRIEIVGSAEPESVIPRQVWVIAALAGLLGSMVWAFSHLAKKTEEVVANKRPTVREAVPPPSSTAPVIAAATPHPTPAPTTPPRYAPAPATRLGAVPPPVSRPMAPIQAPRIRPAQPVPVPEERDRRDERDMRDDRESREERDRERENGSPRDEAAPRGAEPAPPAAGPPSSQPEPDAAEQR